MLRLTAIRLINWYHYTDEIIPVRGNTLFCGDNGSGKTTILDAVQLALVGDASMCEFNRAAQNQGKATARRSITGYVRYQTGEEEEGQKFSFARPVGTTGYIMVEFRDVEKPDRDFTCGVAIDAREAGPTKTHFFLPLKGVRDVPALTSDDLVRPLREFRVAARAVDAKVTDDVKQYQGDLRHRLGRVPEHFHRLIIKALEFKPMATVKDFVIKYLAEPKPINSQPLIDNISHYRQMDREAADAEAKIAALTKICHQGEAIQRDRLVLQQHEYLVLRARIDEQEGLIAKEERDLHNSMGDAERADEWTASATRKRDAYRREEQRLRDEIAKSPAHRRVQQLREELTRVQGEIKEAEEDRKQLTVIAGEQLAAMSALPAERAVEARRLRGDLFEERSGYGRPDAPERVDDLRERLLEQGYLRGHDLRAWEMRSEYVTDQLSTAKARLKIEGDALREEGTALAAERRELGAGRSVYHEGARGLIEHLKRNLKGNAEPRVLSEVIDVPNARWRDAVEMALGTRRLFLLVDPADYDRASRMYERFREGSKVWGTGIVDLERVRRERRGTRPRSLAEQVDTSDADARAYVDYLLGDMICVDDVGDLRKHTRAITDTGATYGSAAMSNIDPKALERRYIGIAARQRRIDDIDARLNEIRERMQAIQTVESAITTDLALFVSARKSLRTMDVLTPRVTRLTELRVQESQKKKHIASIDLGDKAVLDEQLAEAVRLVERGDEEIKNALGARNEAGTRMRDSHDRLQAARTRLAAARQEWRGVFPLDRLTEVTPGSDEDPWHAFEARYAEEREKNRAPAVIAEVYARKQKEFASRIQNAIIELVGLKREFNTKHYEIIEPLHDGFAEYRQQRIVWEESKLPQYRAEIAKAQALAVRQMGEDIVCRLHENFAQLRQDIRDLNGALRELTFGNDRFEFKLEVATAKRAYYDVIIRTAAQPTSAAGDPEQSLFDGQARPLDSLTDDLTRLVESFLRAHDEQVKTELEEITDYREYFTYDLKITHAVTGKTKSYDFVAGTGSGGEVQSALYIAFLASMYQMYRANTRDRRPVAGTVLLDEAFGKNDGKRIAATLKFARTFGLQLILAMPAERMDILGPQMDTTVFLHKDAATGVPSVLDFTKEFEDETLQAATLAMLEAEGDPTTEPESAVA